QNFLPPPESQSNLQPMGNKVYFSISESQKLDNDILTITLKATSQERSANKVMEKVNRKMQTAIASLKNYPDIEVQTSQYRVHPIYNKGETIRHWNGSQSLVITLDANSKQLKVLTKLQEHLTYQSMHFKISAPKKQKAVQQLTLSALKTFQEQAKLIADAFGATNYRLLETRINSPLPQGNPQAATFSSRMVMAKSMTAPAIESGQSTLTVHISGVLLLSQ
ncbi:MAG: SIMPL domain-containing protein, partial [Thiomicrorhabdus sp.]|nr:SIMPL domain-containing protein [Thiomicrorhabdus sp.]